MGRDRDGLIVVFFIILFGALVLVFSYRAQVADLKHDIYQQCLDRKAYDESSQNARAVARTYWQQQIDNEKTNRFIDESLRVRRVRGAQSMVDALSDTLGKSVRGGCDAYRP